MCSDDFFFLSFLLKSAVNPFLFFLSFFLCLLLDGRKFVFPDPSSTAFVADDSRPLCYAMFDIFHLDMTRLDVTFIRVKRIKKKRRKVDTTRWGRHNMAVIRNRVLIWFEAAKEIAKIKSRERYNQKRRGKKEYVKKISLERRDEQDCTIRKTNSMFSSRDSKWGNKKCQRELGIFQML